MFHPAYALMMFAGLAVSAIVWTRIVRRDPAAGVLAVVYVTGIVGAVLGAKAVYLLAEWPFHRHEPNALLNALVGKTILGALPGGYLGVEAGKRIIGYRQPTGDTFAVVVPLGIALGRIGCLIQGCCLGLECGPAWYAIADSAGTPRYPVALVEGAFNLALAAGLWMLSRRRLPALRGQLFHLYLIAYGLFRIGHEFYRQTPRIAGVVSTYQIAAALLAAFGAWRFIARRRQMQS